MNRAVKGRLCDVIRFLVFGGIYINHITYIQNFECYGSDPRLDQTRFFFLLLLNLDYMRPIQSTHIILNVWFLCKRDTKKCGVGLYICEVSNKHLCVV